MARRIARFGSEQGVAYRGYKKEIQNHVNPGDRRSVSSITSRIGDGFNLEGKIKANDL